MSSVMTLKSYGTNRWGKIGARRMVSTLPYDAEVEWLESPLGVVYPAKAFIDTGLNYFPDFEIEASVPQDERNVTLYTDSTHLVERFSQDTPVWSCRVDTSMNSSVSVYGRHTISLRNSVFSVDGVSAGTFNNRTWGRGRTNLFRNTGNGYGYGFTLYRCKLWDSNNILVRDFVPVRIGAVGAMYDRRGVGGMNQDGSARTDGLYFNRGTGAFIVGPDKIA